MNNELTTLSEEDMRTIHDILEETRSILMGRLTEKMTDDEATRLMAMAGCAWLELGRSSLLIALGEEGMNNLMNSLLFDDDRPTTPPILH